MKKITHLPGYLLFPCLLKLEQLLFNKYKQHHRYACWFTERAIVLKEPTNKTLPIHWPGIPPAMQKSPVPLPLAPFHHRSNAKGIENRPAVCSQINVIRSHKKSIVGPGLTTSSPQYRAFFVILVLIVHSIGELAAQNLAV